MSKIVIDARRLRQTTGRYTRNLLDGLQKIDKDNEYHVIALEEDEAHWQPANKNFSLHVTNYDHYTVGEQIGFAKYLQAMNADLVHFAMPQQPVLYRGPRVTTIHDLTLVKFHNAGASSAAYRAKQVIFKAMLKHVARQSERIITISKFSQAEIAEYANVPPEKIAVTYPSAEPITAPTEPLKGLKETEFIFYTGNAPAHKNIRKLIDAHARILTTKPHLRLALVGKTTIHYQKLAHYAAEKGLGKNIVFTGFVSEGQLRWLFENATAYVFPSLNEGFGLPGLEAMHYNLPLVSSNASCLPEVYGKAAHYFDPNSSEDIALKTIEVLQSKQLQRQLTVAAQKQRTLYSWEAMAKQTHAVYIQALEA